MEKRKDIDMLRFYGGDIHQKNKEGMPLVICLNLDLWTNLFLIWGVSYHIQYQIL